MDIEKKISTLAGRIPKIRSYGEYIESAVLLPLVKYRGELYVLFEKRALALEAQPGEICFPGGKIEASEDARTAAIREACEELNLNPEDINIIAPLDVVVSPFGVIVYPFLAHIEDIDKIKINPDEVEYIFHVPLSYFLKNEPLISETFINIEFPKNFPYELIPNGENYSSRNRKITQHFFLWGNDVIWGLTARILIYFLELIK